MDPSFSFGFTQATQAIASALGALFSYNMSSITIESVTLNATDRGPSCDAVSRAEIVCFGLNSIQWYCIRAQSSLNGVKCHTFDCDAQRVDHVDTQYFWVRSSIFCALSTVIYFQALYAILQDFSSIIF